MARYIDAERLIQGLRDAVERNKLNEIAKDLVNDVINLLQREPTADVVEVVRCKDCKHSINIDKNCVLNRNVYKHCQLWRGEELTNIWHRYKKYYKDYSIVELDGFCDSGERKSVTDTNVGSK